MPEEPSEIERAESSLRLAIINLAKVVGATTDAHWLKDFAVVAYWHNDSNSTHRYTTHMPSRTSTPHSAEGMFRAGVRVIVDGDDPDEP